jgi:outer membrane usher protein
VVDSDVLRTLQGNFAGRTSLTPADFEASGIRLAYDPQELALELEISPERRATRSVLVSPIDRQSVGDFVQPAMSAPT